MQFKSFIHFLKNLLKHLKKYIILSLECKTGVKSLNQLTLAQKTIEGKLQQRVDNVSIDNTFFHRKILQMLIFGKCMLSLKK